LLLIWVDGKLAYTKTADKIDATENCYPLGCDSHTHIVYAGNREQEFVDRTHHSTYEEITVAEVY
jgi:hypothetical protein